MKYFLATVLSFIIVFGAIQAFHTYQIAAPTPDQAVNKYYAKITWDSPMEGTTIRVLSLVYIGPGQVFLAALRANSQDRDMSHVGFALLKKTIFGWSVEDAQLYGKSPRPRDALVRLDQLDHKPVVYGQVFLAAAARVEVAFSDADKGLLTVASEIPGGNFALLGSEDQELLELRVLDSAGKVLKQFTKDELLSE